MSTVLGSGSFQALQVVGPVDLALGGSLQYTRIGQPAPTQLQIITPDGTFNPAPTSYPEVTIGTQGGLGTRNVLGQVSSGTYSHPSVLSTTGNKHVEVGHNREGGGNSAVTGGNQFIESTENGLMASPPYFSNVQNNMQACFTTPGGVVTGGAPRGGRFTQSMGQVNPLTVVIAGAGPLQVNTIPAIQVGASSGDPVDTANTAVVAFNPSYVASPAGGGIVNPPIANLTNQNGVDAALAILSRPLQWTLTGQYDDQSYASRHYFLTMPDVAQAGNMAVNLQNAIESLLGSASASANSNPLVVQQRHSRGGLGYGDWVSVDINVHFDGVAIGRFQSGDYLWLSDAAGFPLNRAVLTGAGQQSGFVDPIDFQQTGVTGGGNQFPLGATAAPGGTIMDGIEAGPIVPRTSVLEDPTALQSAAPSTSLFTFRLSCRIGDYTTTAPPATLDAGGPLFTVCLLDVSTNGTKPANSGS